MSRRPSWLHEGARIFDPGKDREGVVQEIVHGRRIGMAMRYTGVKRQDDRHQIEFWLATLLRTCRSITGTHLKPALVRLSHYRAKGHARLARFMGCEVEFGAPRDEILDRCGGWGCAALGTAQPRFTTFITFTMFTKLIEGVRRSEP